jgi:hypothetical protein
MKNPMVDFDGVSYPATLPTRWPSSTKKEAAGRRNGTRNKANRSSSAQCTHESRIKNQDDIRKQSSISLSTFEAEYKAGTEATFTQESSTELKMDNAAAISNANGSSSSERRKPTSNTTTSKRNVRTIQDNYFAVAPEVDFCVFFAKTQNFLKGDQTAQQQLQCYKLACEMPQQRTHLDLQKVHLVRMKKSSNAKPSLYRRISQIVLMRKRRHAGSVTHAAGRHRVSESETGQNRTTVRCTYKLPLSNEEQKKRL